MKVLGLDLGTRTLGIAISDAHHMLARGLETFRFEADRYDYAVGRVLYWLAKEPVETIVLGYPKNMDGSEGSQSIISKDFKVLLAAQTDVPVVLWDERLSSKMAQSTMIHSKMNRKKRKSRIDEAAAVVILQSYLDAKS